MELEVETYKYFLKNYLKDRSQFTIANNKQSNSQELRCGVPQGSVLGPLLFLVYINDLFKVTEDLSIVLYADDTVVYRKGKNLLDITREMQSDLNLISQWTSQNKLSINTM